MNLFFNLTLVFLLSVFFGNPVLFLFRSHVVSGKLVELTWMDSNFFLYFLMICFLISSFYIKLFDLELCYLFTSFIALLFQEQVLSS
jgi:hypothetical protein